MKKTSLILAFLAYVCYAHAQIVITEIMYNPPEGGNDTLEYIELYNNSNGVVDISGWTFTQGITHTFPAGTTMPAGSYVVLAVNPNAFQSVFGFTPTKWDGGALSNTPGEDIELRNSNGDVIDYVDYLNTAPWPTEAAGNGSSLVLCDYDEDNALPANWIGATTGTGVIINGREVFGNPNAASNCQSGSVIANPDNPYIASEQSSLLNVLANDQFIGANPVITLTQAPLQGTATVVGDRILYVPDPGFCGKDLMIYQVNNGTTIDTALVNLRIRCYPTRSIATMTTENAEGRADSLLASCELSGIVYGVNLRPVTGMANTLLFTLIDQTGNGISVSSTIKDWGYTVQETDRVTVRGYITQQNGLTEIVPDTLFKVSANNPLLTPTVVSILNENTESKLVRINNVRLVDPIDWTTGMGGSGFNVRIYSEDNPQDTLLLRIDRDVETYNAPVPAQPFTLTGIGGQFDSSAPFTSGYQILPRYNPDISTLVSIEETDFSHAIRITPNPAVEMLQIEMEQSFDRISIMTSRGRVVKTLNQPDQIHKVDVSLLPSGTYFLRFDRGNTFWTTKFVKL